MHIGYQKTAKVSKGSSLNDGGAATNASMLPCGLAKDAIGNLYIADENNRLYIS